MDVLAGHAWNPAYVHREQFNEEQWQAGSSGHGHARCHGGRNSC